MQPADPLIRRRWLLGLLLLAGAWFLLLWPLANALYGLPGKAPSNDAQADRLIYEDLVKLALLLVPCALAAWLGVRTFAARIFPPPGLRVPVTLSVTRGPAAMAAGLALLTIGLAALAFRVVSLQVSLELAALLREIQ